VPSAIQERAAEIEAELANVAASAELIYRNAREENREPLEAENASLARLGDKRDALNNALELATRSYAIDDNIRAKLDLIRSSGQSSPIAYRDAGSLLWDMLHAQSDQDAAERYRRNVVRPVLERAAEHMGLDKANTVAVAGGFNGLVVAPNVGPVLDPFPGDMPLFSALSPQTITSVTFNRPRIVDPNFTTGVGTGKKEKEESVSKAWDILMEPVTMQLARGYINVSELLLEMLAESLNMVVSHMNKRLANLLEMTAITRVGDTTAAIPLAADAKAEAVQAAVAQASGLVARATGKWATWLAAGIDGMVRLASLTDAAGVAIFPFLNPVNAGGQGGVTGPPSSVYGLSPIFTPGITGADLYIGNADSIEAYERRFPLMQALEPSLFGRQIAVAGGYAYYDPITTESPDGGTTPAKREGVVRIDWA
jgi:hypothetical protein